MSVADRSAFRQAILLGLAAVPKCGVPGNVVPFGVDSSFCVIPSGNDGSCPMAASVYGNGKVIALGHNGFLHGVSGKDDKAKRLGQLLYNSIVWGTDNHPGASFAPECAMKKKCDSDGSIRVSGLGMDAKAVHNFIEGVKRGPLSFKTGKAFGDSNLPSVKAVVDSSDVIVWTNANPRSEVVLDNSKLDERISALLSFVNQGGLLIVGICPWGWEQVGHGAGAQLDTTCLFNLVMERTGLKFVGSYTEGDVNGEYLVSNIKPGSDLNGVEIARKLLTSISKRQPPSQEEIVTSISSFGRLPPSAYGFPFVQLPPGLPCQLRAVRQVVQQLEASLAAFASSIKFPIQLATEKNFDRICAALYVSLFTEMWKYVAPQSCPKAATLGETPGDVLPGTPRILEGSVWTANPYLEGLQTTGVYVPAGELVTIAINEATLTSFPNLELRIQVGAHTDGLDIMKPQDKNYRLNRWPKIVTARDWNPKSVSNPNPVYGFHNQSPPEKASTILVASPFGGMLYIELKKKPDTNLSVPISFLIRNGVYAPYWNVQKEIGEVPVNPMVDSYPHRQMSMKERYLRFGAPFGELETRYMHFLVPRSAFENLADPMEIAAFWDSVLCHELALGGDVLGKKERVSCDTQISAGYMHSGYPIMTFLDIATAPKGKLLPPVFDVEQLRKEGSWGLFHEMGHNRQKGEWTFGGTGEVTVNIFSMYCFQMLQNKPPSACNFVKDNTINQGIKYLTTPSMTFDKEWKSDPGLALGSYAVFIEQFGWKVIADVFREYKDLPANQRPGNDDDKIAQWILRLSKHVNLDLRPYFSQWKWPTGHQTLNELNSLPKYQGQVVDVLKKMKETSKV